MTSVLHNPPSAPQRLRTATAAAVPTLPASQALTSPLFPGTGWTFKSSSASPRLTGAGKGREGAPEPPWPRTHGPALCSAAPGPTSCRPFVAVSLLSVPLAVGWEQSEQLARPLASDCSIDCAPHALCHRLLARSGAGADCGHSEGSFGSCRPPMPSSPGSGLWVSAPLPLWHFLWQGKLLCVTGLPSGWKSYQRSTAGREAGGKTLVKFVWKREDSSLSLTQDASKLAAAHRSWDGSSGMAGRGAWSNLG